MATDIVRVETGERAFLDQWLKDALVKMASPKDAETREALMQDINDLCVSLAGPTPSPVERVLAETASLCWFDLRHAEAQCTGKAMTFAQSDHAQRRIDRAHRRLMSTLRTLAQVRRLAFPTVQVNLAHQQVNMVEASAR